MSKFVSPLNKMAWIWEDYILIYYITAILRMYYFNEIGVVDFMTRLTSRATIFMLHMGIRNDSAISVLSED